MPEPDAPEDDSVDLILRHISHHFPDDLARAILGPEVSSAVPYETQLDARQRRLDRTLDARVNGARRLLHIEWQNDLPQEVPFRIFEYHVMLALSAAAEAREKQQPVPPIDSVVVLLSGREEPWPSFAAYRTSSEGARFSGVHYRIEPVYQYTVAELEGRSSPFWLIFAPLAVDADADKLTRLLAELRKRSRLDVFEELGTAMAVLADADGRRRGLRDVIRSLLPEELVMQNWIFQEGREQGRIDGRTFVHQPAPAIWTPGPRQYGSTKIHFRSAPSRRSSLSRPPTWITLPFSARSRGPSSRGTCSR